MPEAFKKVRKMCWADFFFFFFFDGGEAEQAFCFSFSFSYVSPVYESCSTKEGSTMKKIALSLGLRNDLFLLYLFFTHFFI